MNVPESLTTAEIFKAQNKRAGAMQNVVPLNMTEEDKKAFEGAETNIKGQVQTSSALKTYMYFRSPYGWRPRVVSSNSVGELLAAGALPHCGDCGSNRCGLRVGTDITEATMFNPNPNSCPAKEKIQFRRCPVCKKMLLDYDPSKDLNRPAFDSDEEEMEELIKDDAYIQATPEMRTKARLDRHLQVYHSTEAAMFGIQPLPPTELIRSA